MDSITGVVLCGGAGRRFGGMDKPLVTLNGRTIAIQVIERLLPQVDSLVLSANRNLGEYRKFGFTVVSDRTSGLGPLGGIEAAFEIVETPLLFVCPGDCPLLPEHLVALLSDMLQPDVDAVVPHDGIRRQPLFMLVRQTCRESLVQYLSSGGRSVQGWLESLHTVELAVANEEAFFNINTSEDLLKIERNS